MAYRLVRDAEPIARLLQLRHRRCLAERQCPLRPLQQWLRPRRDAAQIDGIGQYDHTFWRNALPVH